MIDALFNQMRITNASIVLISLLEIQKWFLRKIKILRFMRDAELGLGHRV